MLIDCDAVRLEAMDDTTLLAHFQSMLDITRPERNVQVNAKKEQQIAKFNPGLAKGMAVAKELGIDMSLFDLTKKRKK